MKKMRKKNNKGFTLVELIVVVLIMAILAAALAPQVMKWVNNSRISADVATYDSLVSGIQLALSDEATYKLVKAAYDNGTTDTSVVVTISSTNPVSFSGLATASAALDNQLMVVLSDDYKTTTRAKVSGNYTITIDGGTVEKTLAPNGTTLN